MRNATVYGVSPRLRLDIVLNNLVAWAHTTGTIRLQSDGTPWRPLVHVQDIARAALALLDAPDELVRGEAFNIGSAEQNYRIRDLAEVLAAVPGCEVEFASDARRPAHLPRRLLAARACVPRVATSRGPSRAGAPRSCCARRKSSSAFHDASCSRAAASFASRQLRHLLDSGALEEGLRWTAAASA